MALDIVNNPCISTDKQYVEVDVLIRNVNINKSLEQDGVISSSPGGTITTNPIDKIHSLLLVTSLSMQTQHINIQT